MPILRKQNTLQAEKDNNKNKGKMKYEATVSVSEGHEIISRSFLQETNSTGERSSFTIQKKGKDGTEFLVKADDATALRATLNSIAKGLCVIEKTSRIK